MYIDAAHAAFLQTPANAPSVVLHPHDYAFKGDEESPQLFRRLIKERIEPGFLKVVCGFGDAAGDGEPEPLFPAKQLDPLFAVKTLNGRTRQEKIADPSRMNDECTLVIGTHETRATSGLMEGIFA